MPGGTDLVDLAIGITVLETVALLSYHRWTGRGISPQRLLPTIGAGLFLMLALRFATGPSSDGVMAAFLGCAGIAHALDVSMRWRRQ